MGDSACLLHGFSYASAVPNESKQGNHMHALGESISFGRFTTETLSWERWSTFSHKRYVAEAEKYARPGSVAQKKAFFEAHYKRIAAQRAAAALALLEQENAAKTEGTQQLDDIPPLNPNPCLVESGTGDVKILDLGGDDREKIIIEEAGGERGNEISNKDSLVSVSECSETSQAEKPLLKNSVDNEEVSSVMRKTSIRHRRIPSTPARTMMATPHSTRKSNADEKRSSPKSLRALLSLGSFKESDKEVKKKRGSPIRIPKDCSTPFKTPAPAPNTANPLSQNTRIDPAASGRKTTGPKWHILSAVCSKSLSAYRNKLQSPTVSTPFMLRTEERAAKRKQKLEEKFNATEVQKTQQKTLKEKAGNEIRKLGCGFCFKARPLPDFYKDGEPPNNQMKKKKPPAVQAQVTVAARSFSYKNNGGTISMPPPPPPPTSRVPRNLSKKNVLKQTKLLNTSLPERITHENASPNIQQ